MPNAREALSVHCCRFCSYKVGNRIIHDDLVVGGGAKTLPHTAHEEAKKIVAEPFPQQEELDSKEERLKVLTDELNQAAIEAKKNAPKREKTCYFERAKMKRDAARLAKKPRTPKDKPKSKDKKQEIE